MKKVLIIVLAITYFLDVYSQDTATLKYFPLSVGNIWVYNVFSIPGGSSYIQKTGVSATSIINGHLYYQVFGFEYIHQYSFVRVDSNYGTILFRTTSNSCNWLSQETAYDSLNAEIYDSCTIYCSLKTVCMDTSNGIIFNLNGKTKKFHTRSDFLNYQYRYYFKNFGMYYIDKFWGVGYRDTWTLKGCIINGVVYGDTSMTGINKISVEIPEKLSLHQNYPNPFNPATKIRFNIPPSKGAREMIKLIIYDVLGRDVATLVNEHLKPGTYEVDWDGTNYPSGIYFCKLTVSNASAPLSITYTETKKMVFIK